MNLITEKICSKCKILKPLIDFSPGKNTPDGRHSWCRVCKYEGIKKYRAVHPESEKATYKKYRNKNPERIREMHREWCKNHLEASRVISLRFTRKIRKTPLGRLNINISTAISMSLRGEKHGRSWESLVGFTLENLKRHLEKNFLPGMTWGNRNLWHIDHKIPIAAFNFERSEDIDFRRCWNLKNLRPLWKSKNLSKGAKLEIPFQPALPF